MTDTFTFIQKNKIKNIIHEKKIKEEGGFRDLCGESREEEVVEGCSRRSKQATRLGGTKLLLHHNEDNPDQKEKNTDQSSFQKNENNGNSSPPPLERPWL